MPSNNLTDPLTSDAVPRLDNAIAVGEDLQFQERWWKFERTIWSLFALVLLADVLGLFGRGWLARAELHQPASGIDVKYERVERASTPSIMSLSFEQEAITGNTVQLFMNDTLLKELGTQRIIPQPERSVVGNGGVTYTFPIQGLPAHVDLALEPSFPGVHQFTLQVPGHEPAVGHVLVMP